MGNFGNLHMDRLRWSRKESGGLHSIIRGTLFCSRFMGLLPLSGLTSKTSDQLRFTLWSPYTIYYAITLFGQVLMFITTCCYLAQNGISLSNVTNSFFYTSSLLSSLILMNIGRFWPLLVTSTEALESKLPPFNRNVGTTTTVTMVFILVAAAVEHILSMIYGLAVAHSCDSNNVAENYFKFNMPWIFDYTPFSIWKGVVSEIFNIQSTFIWSFNDLLIMVISIYLTEHFLVHNELLKKAVDQEYFSCTEFRTQYLKIVRLVKLVNGQFGIYILTSFGVNLYWICTQLFYTLNRTQTGHFIACKVKDPKGSQALHGVEHSIYFTYSFSFLATRTLLVLLLAARIHSNAAVPLVILYDLPRAKFDIEVERFISQITNIKIAMSGLDFFYVTRTMILTLLGTIVTYELVLLQFNK
ncbi:gustatory receptor for sugar taste 64f-like [Anticarsia gemmatalis]|uniref:gustatory receptor for sugar taste 64f-like n=1 Tax=Anticarsia gemmatalis TaxID=129554 RepID=UPI003F75B436